MKEAFSTHFLGSQDVWFHFFGLLFALLTCGIVKYYYFKVHQAEERAKGNKVSFKMGYWLFRNTNLSHSNL